jgi:hypothetical protein
VIEPRAAICEGENLDDRKTLLKMVNEWGS